MRSRCSLVTDFLYSGYLCREEYVLPLLIYIYISTSKMLAQRYQKKMLTSFFDIVVLTF